MYSCTFLGEIDSERENFLARDTALYGYAALQPRGFAALHGLVQRLRPVGPNGRAASDGAMASGLWGCSERAPLRDDGFTVPLACTCDIHAR